MLDFTPDQLHLLSDPLAIRKRASSSFTLGGLYQSAVEINEFVSQFPRRANKIIDLVADNQLRVHVDAVDEQLLIGGIQKVANRITLGLLMAALIIGASLMINVDTPLKLFGYPIISLFFFIAASAGAIVLMGRMLFKDRVR